MFCLCSLLGVWWCLVLHLSLYAILSLFSCMVWGYVPVSLICMRLSRFPSNACWKDCLFPILCSCLLCQRLIDHRCLGLFLGSIGLSVCFGTSTTLSWLLWLWRRPVATAPIQPLAWEPPYARGAAQEIATTTTWTKKTFFFTLLIGIFFFFSF